MGDELRKHGFLKESIESIQSAQPDSKPQLTQHEELLIELNQKFVRFKDMHTARVDELAKKLTLAYEQIAKLQANIKEIGDKGSTLVEKEVSEASCAEKVSPKQAIEPKKKPYYQKQGKFNPGDIDINEIFYFGNRKR